MNQTYAQLFKGKQPRNREMIIKVLLKLKASGKAEGTLQNISYCLAKLGRNADLAKPEEVKLFVADLKVANSYKQNLIKAYAYLTAIYDIPFTKPRYKHERKIPIIPTKENLMKIISSSKKYAVIFKLLMETGLMPYELAKVKQQDVDLERCILQARGYKGHASRNFKLTKDTTAMLGIYFKKYGRFPESKWMSVLWRQHRDRTAHKLQESNLRRIRLYDLRHYYATMLYAKTRDILLVKQQMGHKKIETTMLYVQILHLNEDNAFTCKTATNVKEASQLIENGFQYVTEMDGLKLFKKRK